MRLKPICYLHETYLKPTWILFETCLNRIEHMLETYLKPFLADLTPIWTLFSSAAFTQQQLLWNCLKTIWNVSEICRSHAWNLTWSLLETHLNLTWSPEVIWIHLEPEVSKIHDRSFIFGKFIEKVLKTHDTLDFLGKSTQKVIKTHDTHENQQKE